VLLSAVGLTLPAGAQEFVPEIALLQVDTNKAVRTFVAEYLEKACLQGAHAHVLGTSLQACLALLSDPTPAVRLLHLLAIKLVYARTSQEDQGSVCRCTVKYNICSSSIDSALEWKLICAISIPALPS
jgi:hypothetical protein